MAYISATGTTKPTVAAKQNGLARLRLFLASTHEANEDGSPGKKYDVDLDKIKLSKILDASTGGFWESYAFWMVYTYETRENVVTAYTDTTIEQYLRKSWNAVKEYFESTRAKEEDKRACKDFFQSPASAEFLTKLITQAQGKTNQLRVAIGLRVVSKTCAPSAFRSLFPF